MFGGWGKTCGLRKTVVKGLKMGVMGRSGAMLKMLSPQPKHRANTGVDGIVG